MAAIGEDILSIGSRKWEAERNSTFESAPNFDHSAFMLPNVENVSRIEIAASFSS
jgi:hypothetical protein